MNEISFLGALAEALADVVWWVRRYRFTVIATVVILVILVLLIVKVNDQESECRARGGVPIHSRTDGLVCTKGRLGR